MLNRRWQFHDVQLSRSVQAAYHALAIDEKRRPFQPTLWEQNPQPGEQILEQVWFPGCHGNVGGGGANPGLSDITLKWMADKANARGLVLRKDAFTPTPSGDDTIDEGRRFDPDPLAPIHDSSSGIARILGRIHRKIGSHPRGNESIASTVVQRRDADSGYRPPELETFLTQHRDRVTDVTDPGRPPGDAEAD